VFSCDVRSSACFRSWGGREVGKIPIEVKVNGVVYRKEVEPRKLLVHFLRQDLQLLPADQLGSSPFLLASATSSGSFSAFV